MNLYSKLQVAFCCLLLLVANPAKAQLNLIPDPSFEDTTGIVDGAGTTSLKRWHNLDSNNYYCAPFSYFSYITQNPPYSLPDNQWCYQNSHSGGGVIEFDFIWTANPFWKRSLARTKLKSLLVAGKTYCAKMYVNPCEKYYGYFTDGIAMYFDNGQLDTMATILHDTSGVYTFVNPQVNNPSGNVLSDTMNWVAVSGTFVANGTETFLTIGNFKTDAATTKVFNPVSFVPPDTVYASALIIDDVSVIPLDAANWLHDTSCILGDSVYIGLPKYEFSDGMWYDINMNYIGKGSGIKVKPTQWATKYIQQIDLCGIIRLDTLTVWAAPLGLAPNPSSEEEGNIRVYPNPSDGEFSILSNGSLINASLRIISIIGETILQREGLNGRSFSFNISGEPSGVYFVEIKMDKGIRRTKLIKE